MLSYRNKYQVKKIILFILLSDKKFNKIRNLSKVELTVSAECKLYINCRSNSSISLSNRDIISLSTHEHSSECQHSWGVYSGTFNFSLQTPNKPKYLTKTRSKDDWVDLLDRECSIRTQGNTDSSWTHLSWLWFPKEKTEEEKVEKNPKC